MNKNWQQALETGDLQELKRLKSSSDVESLNRFNQTSIMIAAHKGELDIVDWLIDQGAELDHTAKHGLSALMLAVIGRHEETVKSLINAGANPHLRATGSSSFSGKTALEIAEDNSDQGIIRALKARTR